jgi:hypothetical protein
MDEFSNAPPVTPARFVGAPEFTLARLSMGCGSRFGRSAAAKGGFTLGRFPMRPGDSAVPIPPLRLRRFPGR